MKPLAKSAFPPVYLEDHIRHLIEQVDVVLDRDDLAGGSGDVRRDAFQQEERVVVDHDHRTAGTDQARGFRV